MSTPQTPLPPVVDVDTWRRELDALRVREKAATRELDAIAAQRRRLPMVELPDYTLVGEDGPVRLPEIFGEHRVTVVQDLPDALDKAAELADEGGVGGGVVATGSVVTAAEVRMLLGVTHA